MAKYVGAKERKEELIWQVGGFRFKQLSQTNKQEQHFVRIDMVIRFRQNTRACNYPTTEIRKSSLKIVRA